MKKLRIIVAGNRDYDDYKRIAAVCRSAIDMLENSFKQPFEEVEIITGEARGVDSCAERFAHANNYQLSKYWADWESDETYAGLTRNLEMVKYAISHACPENNDRNDIYVLVIAFWDGRSLGTKSLIDTAAMWRVNGIIVEYHPCREEIHRT